MVTVVLGVPARGRRATTRVLNSAPPVATGTVAVVVTPGGPITNATPETLVTNAGLTTYLRTRPGVFPTDSAGNALTNYPPVGYPLSGDLFKFLVHDSKGTNKTWRAVVKFVTR